MKKALFLLIFMVYWSAVASATVSRYEGLFCVSGRDQPVSNFSSCLANPSIDGVAYYASWSTLETADGVYNWTEITNALNALSPGQHAAIEIDAGAYSPAWLFAADPTMDFTFIWKGISSGPRAFGSAVNMPIPWNTTFQTKWQAFVDAAAAQFASDSRVVAVNMFPIDRGNVTDNFPHNGWINVLTCPATAPASFCSSFQSLQTTGNISIGTNSMQSGAALFTSALNGLQGTIVNGGTTGFNTYLHGYAKYVSPTQMTLFSDAGLTIPLNASHTVAGQPVDVGTYPTYSDSDNWVTAGYTRLKIENPTGLDGAWDLMAQKLLADFPNQKWIDPVNNYGSNFCAFPPIDDSGTEHANDGVTYIDYQDCLINAYIDIQGGGFYAHNSCTGCRGSALYAANWASAAGNLTASGGSAAVAADGAYVATVYQFLKQTASVSDFASAMNWVIAHASSSGTAVEIYPGDVNGSNQAALDAAHAALTAGGAPSAYQSTYKGYASGGLN